MEASIAEANADVTRAVGDSYEEKLRLLANGHRGLVEKVEGSRHMLSLFFHEMEAAKAFTADLVAGGLDISVQTYKADCPPSALTKLPLIAGYDAVEMVVERMDRALRGVSGR